MVAGVAAAGRIAAGDEAELPDTEEFKIAVALAIPRSLTLPVLIPGEEEGRVGGIPEALTGRKL